MHLAQVTRYDIMYATSQLAQAMSKPSNVQIHGSGRLQHYLQEERFQAHSVFGRQLGQQPRQRQVNVVISHDDGEDSRELQVRNSESRGHVDHRSRTRGCSPGNETGNSVQHVRTQLWYAHTWYLLSHLPRRRPLRTTAPQSVRNHGPRSGSSTPESILLRRWLDTPALLLRCCHLGPSKLCKYVSCGRRGNTEKKAVVGIL